LKETDFGELILTQKGGKRLEIGETEAHIYIYLYINKNMCICLCVEPCSLKAYTALRVFGYLGLIYSKS